MIREKRFTKESGKLSEKVITYFHEEVGAGVQDGGTSFCRGPKVGKSIVLEKVNDLIAEEEQTQERIHYGLRRSL